MSGLSLRLAPGSSGGGRGGGGGGDPFVEQYEFTWPEGYNMRGHLWSNGLGVNSEYPAIGVVEDGWLGILDETTTAGYPSSFPGIGFISRLFPAGWERDFRVRMRGSGIHPIESTPLIHVGGGQFGDPIGVGCWWGHDFEFLGQHFGPCLLFGYIGFPPDNFVIVTSKLVPHTSGVEFVMELRSDGRFVSVHIDDHMEIPPTLITPSLWYKREHGAAIDAHFCTPNYPPYNISPVPSSRTRAIGKLEFMR